ncbi:unnamed protein product [Rotaria sp. Silwood1]|nr:unnamed protein product [Rotaria sp. Silwood1]
MVIQDNGNNDILRAGDFIIFNFHRYTFDIPSLNIFHRDLRAAYECEMTFAYDEHEFRYIDYSVTEQHMPTKIASTFWRETMFGYDWNHPADLPIDRQRNYEKPHTGFAYTAGFKFDDDVAKDLINYASTANISLQALSLACFYVFLFKITNGVGVFAGYYGRPDLTAQVLIDINGEQCYLTGDLGRLDIDSGELFFIGRRDFQVKLRGQRIELFAIELVILRSSSKIINCVVMKEDSEDDSYLAAYIQVEQHIDNNTFLDEIIVSCRAQLPSYMIPSKWFLVPKLPLNASGKIDRKRLRQIASVTETRLEPQKLMILSPLEKKLQNIFFRAFRLNSIPDVLVSFGHLGGTSLGAMRALILIRQEIFEKMDIGLLLSNPSVRELAIALEPLLSRLKFDQEKQEDKDDFSIRPCRSELIETFGIFLLAWQWFLPVFVATKFGSDFLPMLCIPLVHLLQFPLLMTLLGGPFKRGRDTLYSWHYYRLWFLRRLWSLNTYWVGHLLGTPFYNAYLRLCGACIGSGTQIYTSQIDAPWLLMVGDSTYIGDEVVLSSLTYHDSIYDLHQIRIGSHCSIGARSVLHDRVDIHDGVLVEPLTAVTGPILGKQQIKSSVRSLNFWQSLFQFMFILVMARIHTFLLAVSWSATNWLPMYFSLPICWLFWSLLGSAIALLILRLIVGRVQPHFSHPLNSWKFLHRFWLRYLVLSSFGPCLSPVFDGFTSFAPIILRWLGVQIECNDIQIADFVPLLTVPPNLLTIESGVTIASGVCFVPYNVTTNGLCIVAGAIQVGRQSFLGDSCILRSGVCLPANVLVGALTRIDSTGTNAKECE